MPLRRQRRKGEGAEESAHLGAGDRSDQCALGEGAGDGGKDMITLQEAIEEGQCPVFARLCREISAAGHPPEWKITRADWIALQREMSTGWRTTISRGQVMGTALQVMGTALRVG